MAFAKNHLYLLINFISYPDSQVNKVQFLTYRRKLWYRYINAQCEITLQ